MTIFWLVFMIITAVLEAVTVQLVSIWFTVGSLAACITSMFTDNLWIQIIVFVVFSGLALLATRPLAKRVRERDPERTNADRHIGESGIVVVEIDNDNATGQVRVGSSVWSAQSADGSIIPPDTRVIVRDIRGVRLIVEAEASETD